MAVPHECDKDREKEPLLWCPSVKLLPRLKEDPLDGVSGLCATVAFMDIKSAAKAHLNEHKLDERCLSTEYYEPPAPTSLSAYSSPRFSAHG
ncbi:Msx2-interacting protein [Frankliniella fusca]|uniref:Msx2-interacting protein n=1 Tax=Frankliniella fusca TaxID=407009 RepID=A0AAE1HDM4_9NEOP|nr:Msx2-interacting protein [Frankliniella fusca]